MEGEIVSRHPIEGVEMREIGKAPAEKSAILTASSNSAAPKLYTGDARTVEGAERPIILAWKSIKRILGARPTPEGQKRVHNHALGALFVLFLVSVLNQADRWLLPAVAPAGMRCYLVDSHNCSNDSRSDASCGCIDFDTYDQGILTGPAFCAVYVLSGIPLSYLADTKSRTLVLAIGLSFWSAMVLATGFVKETWQLYLTRMGLGIGEATCTPVAFSMLADYFPLHLRALALSLYTSGVYFGGALSYGLTSLAKHLCWVWLFRIFGIAGFAMLLVVLLVLGNPKRQQDDVVPSSEPDGRFTVKETAMRMIKCPPFIAICAAASIRNLGGYALGTWLSTFYRVHFDQTPEQYGVSIAVSSLCGGLIGSVLGGWLADVMSKRGAHWKAYVVALSQILAAPCIVAVVVAPNAKASYGLLFLAYLTAETWLGCAGAIVQDVTPHAIRCQASAVYVAVSTLVGCLGPLAISAILDADKCRPDYKNALLFTIPTFYVASSLLFAGTGVLIHRRFATAPVNSATAALTAHDVLAQQTETDDADTDANKADDSTGL